MGQENKRREFVTSTDLERVIQTIPKHSPVFMGECIVCNERILSFKGPRINCPACSAEIEVQPLFKGKK